MNEQKVRDYLKRFYRKREIQNDENIFELGFANSMFSMQLVMFLEREFNITVDSEDMDPKNFETINSILSLIERKSQQ